MGMLWGRPERDEEYRVEEPIVADSRESFIFRANMNRKVGDKLAYVYQYPEIIRVKPTSISLTTDGSWAQGTSDLSVWLSHMDKPK